MALGDKTFTDIGGAVSDLFASEAAGVKAQGDILEAKNYDLAAALAGKNVEYEETATAVKQAQADRAVYQTTSSIRADVASSGFEESGSAIDILRDNASQGALQKAILGQQGLIQEEAYHEQQQSYLNMETAANVAAQGEKNAAMGFDITAAVKGIAAIATLVP